MKKKLTKSRDDKIFFGVCGGIGKYLEIDPSIIRILLLVSMLWYGSGLLFYLIAAFILPYEEEAYGGAYEGSKDTNAAANKDNQRIIGLILILGGIFLLFQNFHFFFRTELFWPLALMALGIIVIVKGRE